MFEWWHAVCLLVLVLACWAAVAALSARQRKPGPDSVRGGPRDQRAPDVLQWFVDTMYDALDKLDHALAAAHAALPAPGAGEHGQTRMDGLYNQVLLGFKSMDKACMQVEKQGTANGVLARREDFARQVRSYVAAYDKTMESIELHGQWELLHDNVIDALRAVENIVAR